jgi:hypothetical protein
MIKANEIHKAWQEVFPKSLCYGEPRFIYAYLQRRGEWTSGISANDPLWCRIIIDEDYETVTIEGSIMLNPENPVHYASSAKWRKKTLNNPDYKKVVKAFKDIKSFILTHEANWHNQYAAIIKEKLS